MMRWIDNLNGNEELERKAGTEDKDEHEDEEEKNCDAPPHQVGLWLYNMTQSEYTE